ncbi:MAG TPA: tripartite tricarboxylate transporter substrate binding protein [Burkholderiales bacterium]|nr:tripartite tricarboxylate transporter substrate binding protein [Burkholderiales bacterium]
MSYSSSITAALAAVCIAGPVAHAQQFPSKPVRIIVPAPGGGGTDIFARTIAHRLTERWGQQVVVDNRPGAGGIIGSDIVAKSVADGHTLLMAFTSHVTNPSLQSKMPYDTLNDFAPVSMVAVVPSVLVLHSSVPARSVKELIALAKRKPGALNYASAGSGSATHLSAVLFEAMAGVTMVHVPYKGGGPALNDVLGGQVSLMFGNMASTLPHIKSGRLHALAVTSARRTPAAPELPTVAEAGLPGYEATAWFAMLAPAKTPRTVVDKINTEVTGALRLADVKERLANQGADTVPSTPDELGEYIRAELAKWSKVIRLSGAKAD